MDPSTTQGQAAPSSSHVKTLAQQAQDVSDSTQATQSGGLRRSSRVTTQTQKAQDAMVQGPITSTGTNQGHTKTPNMKGASTKVNKKNAAKYKPDNSTSLNNQNPSTRQGKSSTQAHTIRQAQGTPSASQNRVGRRRTKMAANTPNSESSACSGSDGEEVHTPSLPSPSPFYDPQKAGQAQRRGHGGTGHGLTSSPAKSPSESGHRPSSGLSDGFDAMDITKDKRQHPADKNAACMAGPHVLDGGNAHAAAAGPQVPRPQSPPPVLYDYQVDHIAKALAAATKLKEAMETMRKQNPAFGLSVSGVSPPRTFGPVPPPGMAMNHAAKVGSGSGSFPQVSAETTKKKPETIEDIRRNMAKLVDDDPLSDLDFLRQHYNDEGSKKRLREALVPLRGVFSSDKSAFKEHTGTEFMAQRAQSSAHSKSRGEQLPSYAYAAPETEEQCKPAAKKAKTPEEAAAKSVKDFDKANRDYDDAFERNLRSMFN